MTSPIGQYIAGDRLGEFRQNPPAVILVDQVPFRRTCEIDVKTGDVGKFPGNGAARTQDCRHRWVDGFVADYPVDSARDHRDVDGNRDSQITNCLRDLHQAEEAERLIFFAG